MPAKGSALQVGRSAPSSTGASATMVLDDDAIEDAVELPPGQDAALDELPGLPVGTPVDDPACHARRDARKLLDLPPGRPVEIDRLRALRLVMSVQERAPRPREQRRQRHAEDH